ncbi:hypothetical protein [Maribellus luteus]|nr:hypothetical protein [Maribellus luteus]
MKKLPILFLILLAMGATSQNMLTKKGLNFELSGFVRNDFIYDTHRNVDACDHLLDFFPTKPVYDANGEDLNAIGTAQILNTFSRIGSRFSGLEMGNTKISAYVEVDFTGGANTPTVRLRHAYTQLEWAQSKLLFGRVWHPLFIEKVYPSTLNENTGLPFQVFNRSPQLRYTRGLNDNLDLILAAIYQFDYANNGPDGKNYHYQRDALWPNLHAQIQYYDEHWTAGFAADWKTILPRTSVTGTNGTFKADEKLSTIALLAYMKYSKGKFELKAKSMFGQNVCENLMPSGYAVATIDEQTGKETYTPFNHLYNWINFTYGKEWKFGLYAGMLTNFGTSENVEGDIYGFATDAKNMYKLSPQLIYNYKNFMFGVEISLTTVAYGENNKADKAKVINTDNVSNFRSMLSVAYNF